MSFIFAGYLYIFYSKFYLSAWLYENLNSLIKWNIYKLELCQYDSIAAPFGP